MKGFVPKYENDILNEDHVMLGGKLIVLLKHVGKPEQK